METIYGFKTLAGKKAWAATPEAAIEGALRVNPSLIKLDQFDWRTSKRLNYSWVTVNDGRCIGIIVRRN